MRIAFDATSLPPKPAGAAMYVLRLLGALAAHIENHDELVIYGKERDRAALKNLGERVRLVTIPLRSRPTRLLWEQTAFVWRLRRDGIDLLHSPHYTIPLISDVVRVVSVLDTTYLTRPEVHTRGRRFFFRRMIPQAIRRADGIITPSYDTRSRLLRLCGDLDPAKVDAVWLGLDPSFQPIEDLEVLRRVREKYALPDEFVLFVGTIEPRKNVEALVRAVARLRANDRGLVLVLAGQEGWGAEAARRAIDEQRMWDRVRWLGYVDSDDLPALYTLASVFVYPSLEEGFGFPPIEAMACGTPVITTERGSLTEIAAPASVTVDPGDVSSLAEAIDRVVRDRELRTTLISRGRQHSRRFTWDATAEGTLRAYRAAWHRSRIG